MEENQSDNNVAPAAVEAVAEDSKKMGYFDDVIDPPAWLTKDYVEAALRKDTGDSYLKITGYSLKPCTKPGDNFVGVIFRALITFQSRGEEKSESFIVKIEAFLEGSKKDMTKDRPYFNTEGRMYLEVLPEMQELLNNIGDKEVLVPGLVHYSAEPKILIFRDIAPEGFEMCRMPVPLAQSSMIAKKLGKFHALSYYMKEEQGSTLVETFEDGMFTEKDISDWVFMDGYLDTLCDLLCEWDHGTLAYKLKVMQPKFMQKMLDLYKPQPKGHGINVLNHGDFHIRNMLFRYINEEDKSTFEAIRLIDFQCSVYATPAIDLVFLLYMIADEECNDKHRDQLLKVYHDQFKGTLIELGFLKMIPTLLDFQREMLTNGLMELFIVSMFLNFFHMDYSKLEGDFMTIENVPKSARMSYESSVMKKTLLRVLPQLLYKGVLDS